MRNVKKLQQPEFYNVSCENHKPKFNQFTYQYAFAGYIIKVKGEDNDGLFEQGNGKYYSWFLN